VIFSFGVWTESMCILKTLNKQPLCHMFVGFLSYRPKKNKQTKNTERMVSARYIHYLVATEIVDYRPVSKISL